MSRASRSRITAEEWAEMVAAARELLMRAAEAKSTITYGELAAAAGRGRIAARSPLLMRLLDEACEPLDEQFGVVTASLVVRADSGMPGEGYFSWAAASGRDLTDRRAMWLAEARRVYDAVAPRQESE